MIIGGCACGARWRGEAVAHCAVCHLTFRSVSGFDEHRGRRIGDRCRTVEELRECGLEPNGDGHWRRPMPDAARARIAGDRIEDAIGRGAS